MMEYHQTEGKPRHVASTEETSNSHTTFAATCISASKGFWAELLGVGDFYYEVGSQMKHQKQTNGKILCKALLTHYYQYFIQWGKSMAYNTRLINKGEKFTKTKTELSKRQKLKNIML